MRITIYSVKLDGMERLPILAKEFGINYQTDVDSMSSPDSVTKMMNEVFDAENLSEEHLWMLCMDAKCHMKGIFEISKGTVNASIASPREMCLSALLCGAVGIILVHNHPSGDSIPSNADTQVKNRVKKACKIVGFSLLDNIVIGHGSYYSFNEMGIL